MVIPIISPKKYRRYLAHWLFNRNRKKGDESHFQHPWWQVMCLTGVDYFSTLGYQPGIAALAAGALSPLATLILILVTLFGALPIYQQVAISSPHGEGSIAMLEHLLPWWQGKLLVLALLGFVATDFIITITLSAADATDHLVENPLFHSFLHGQNVPLTLILIALLGAVFLKGFQEAIGLAVGLVVLYLALNLIVIGVGGYQVLQNPIAWQQWQSALTTHHSNPLGMIGISLLLFPKLALGLSGFETGVAVMPFVKGYETDDEEHPRGRVAHTHHLLMTAAFIMSFYLITSSLITTILIPAAEFEQGGKASGRALAYLAHQYLGNLFGTLYDFSTIAILWFAGASAMAGLLNLVPRYLPRYGMAPEWSQAIRPLVLVYTAIAFVVTLIFQANVEAQGGAYATGVLVLISSAATAVTLSFYRNHGKGTIFFGLITLVFLYTTVVNIIERPDGIHIATFFIAAIIATSLISRVFRSTELRVTDVSFDRVAEQIIEDLQQRSVHLIAHRAQRRDIAEYRQKDEEIRADNHLPNSDLTTFVEVQVVDASVFTENIYVTGHYVGPYRILRIKSAAIPNAIAALLLEIRDRCGTLPDMYFGWTEGNPLLLSLRFVLLGEGDVPRVTRQVLRKAVPRAEKRPNIHVTG
jgi:hypothetical protein